MKLHEAVSKCIFRGYIMRDSKPELKYWNNHKCTFVERVIENQGEEGLFADDWKCYDPQQGIMYLTEQQKVYGNERSK